jgi:hypothetical protein
MLSKTVRSKEKIERWTRQLHELRVEYNLELEVEILYSALSALPV